MFEEEAIRKVELYVRTHTATGQHRIYNSLGWRTSHTKQFALEVLFFFTKNTKLTNDIIILIFYVKIPSTEN